MLLDRDYKYIWNATDIDELYDRKKDPYELKNLAKSRKHKQVLKEMRLRLYNLMKHEEDGMVRIHFLDHQLRDNHKLPQ